MNRQETWNIYTNDNIHPGFSIDCVLFSFHDNAIKILLSEFALNDFWALPGGFMFKHENADEAAHRILKQRTGLNNIFLRQFYLFSDINRTIIEQNVEYVQLNATNQEKVKWFLRRFISLGYYAFVKYDDVHLLPIDNETTKWYDIAELPPMYSDHENIIETAIKMGPTISSLILIAYELLPEKFTITEIRRIYEIFLGKELDRRNFQRKILSLEYIKQLNERQVSNAYNPPFLFSFNKDKIDSTNLNL